VDQFWWPLTRWHDLRHTAASLMASQGVSLYTIGTVSGHAQAKTTQHYAHLTDDARRQAMESVSAASGL
jgi:integrase